MMATTIMTTDSSRLLLLLNWMSPTFPVGGFAYSHGLEWAIETGKVSDAASLRQWITDLIAHGSGWNDAVIFSACWDAPDRDALNELALALCTSHERYLETTMLGRAFAVAVSSFLLPSWEKADAAQRRPDEGAVRRDGRLPSGDAPSPASGLTALVALSHEGRGVRTVMENQKYPSS